jgi:hypothetical protein
VTHPDLEPRVPLGEAARLLGVAHRTLLNRAHLGTLEALLPGTKKVLGRWRVPVSAIQSLLIAEERRVAGVVVNKAFGSIHFPDVEKRQERAVRRKGHWGFQA